MVKVKLRWKFAHELGHTDVVNILQSWSGRAGTADGISIED